MNRLTLTALVLTVLLAFAGGCTDETQPLQLTDLTPAELKYVTRFITLERARAVTLVHREEGEALLDSLATAWGDSALSDNQAAFSLDTTRTAGLHDLLSRIIKAEEDSLLQAPVARRLTADLPDPAPAKKASD